MLNIIKNNESAIIFNYRTSLIIKNMREKLLQTLWKHDESFNEFCSNY